MKAHWFTVALLTVCAGAIGAAPLPCWAQAVLKPEELSLVVARIFGPKVQLASDGSTSSFPRYLSVSANSGEASALVVPLHVDRAKGTLDELGIKSISRNTHGSVDASIGEHCLGLAIVHGKKWGKSFTPDTAYLLYECFSGYTKIGAGSQLLEHARVPVRNDAILLHLESGGQMLVYWDRGEYATKYVRNGD